MSLRIFRWVTRLASLSLWRDYGAAMEETLARKLADARSGGIGAYTRVFCRELAGLLVVAVSDRFGRHARGARRKRDQERLYKAGAMDTLTQETKHAIRRLWRSPSFTVASVLTLALAIGANTAMFAVVERVILNPLPYPESSQLIEIDHGSDRLRVVSGMGTTAGLYFHYLERSRTIESAALYRTADQTVTGDGEPERLKVARVTPSFASVTRVPPAVGRWFSESEGTPGAASVAVISDRFWNRKFARNPSAIGRQIVLEGVAAEIVGVMPPTFSYPSALVEVWLPIPLARSMGFGLWNFAGVARLRPGVSLDAARIEFTQLLRDVPQAFPGDPLALGNSETTLTFSGRTLQEATIGRVRRALWILLASVGVLLLVACANVVNLFLVRSEVRQRDIAVRRALGAGTSAIARYFFAESAVLSLLGGAIGVALAAAAVQLVVAYGPSNLPRRDEIRLDSVAVFFSAGLSLVVAVVFGGLPLFRSAQLSVPLNEGGRSNTLSHRGQRARHVLMAMQTALALVLLVASGLMMRSFQELRAINPHFDASSTLTFSIGLPERQYSTRASALLVHHKIVDAITPLPSVSSVSATTCLPLAGGCSGNTLRIEGQEPGQGATRPIALFRAVAGGYFETIGTPIIRGRGITRDDVERGEPVAVINEAIAKRYFGNDDPIGKRVASNLPPPRPGVEPELDWLTVVGISANTPMQALAEPNPLPQLYMPLSKATGSDMARGSRIGPDMSIVSFVVRSKTPPQDLLPAVRAAIAGVDPHLALAQVKTLEEILDSASAQMAFTTVLIGAAALIALLLGIVGIYGVMSYIVSQRTIEIGVRLALGAEPGNVAGQILRQGAAVACAGVSVGIAAALAGGRLIESLLYGVSSRDPGILVGTASLLLLIALIACYVPARRAARMNPVEALRGD